MGYRAYQVTTRIIDRGGKYDELIDEECDYAEVKCLHHLCSAYEPDEVTGPIDALEEFMSGKDTSREFGDGEATLDDGELDELMEDLKERFGGKEHEEELEAVLNDLRLVKERDGEKTYHQVTFF